MARIAADHAHGDVRPVVKALRWKWKRAFLCLGHMCIVHEAGIMASCHLSSSVAVRFSILSADSVHLECAGSAFPIGIKAGRIAGDLLAKCPPSPALALLRNCQTLTTARRS